MGAYTQELVVMNRNDDARAEGDALLSDEMTDYSVVELNQE